MGTFNQIARDQNGNVALVFALALIPLFAAVGALIDYARVNDFRAEIAAATDGGLLVVGSQPPMSDKDAYETVNRWIATHVQSTPDGDWKLDSVVQEKSGRITASVSGEVNTAVARLLGVHTIPISVTSEIVSPVGRSELAPAGSISSKDKLGNEEYNSLQTGSGSA